MSNRPQTLTDMIKASGQSVDELIQADPTLADVPLASRMFWQLTFEGKVDAELVKWVAKTMALAGVSLAGDGSVLLSEIKKRLALGQTGKQIARDITNASADMRELYSFHLFEEMCRLVEKGE